MILSQTEGLETNERGLAKISENGQTTRAGVFASGDVVKGAKTVVEAVEQSKRVAYAMHEYLQSLPKTN
jgi:glutamate synthase (NADPH/NADH) small chain